MQRRTRVHVGAIGEVRSIGVGAVGVGAIGVGAVTVGVKGPKWIEGVNSL
jgi:hypothetical protein